MPTGTRSGRWVLDVDAKSGGLATVDAYEKARGAILPFTLSVKTGGGGYHLHWRLPAGGPWKNGTGVLGPGVDVRADGGYVILPPSVHPNGQAYAWVEADAELEEAPDDLTARVLRPQEARTVPPGTPGTPGTGVVREGGRNEALTRLAGKLRRAGLEADEILAALGGANVRVCVPPLPEAELRTIARSIGGREGDPVVAPSSAAPLVDVGADELAVMLLPPRAYILAPVLQEKNMAMIYAERGTGKTLFGVGWALAIAAGATFLRWSASSARRVLYLDGELPVETLQKRILDVARSARLPIAPGFRVVTPDLQPAAGVMPNLGEPAGQARILEVIERVNPEVVFFDNVSTLVRGGEENAAEGWQVVQDFLIGLRTRRISSVLLHHTGKGGDQRGTSKREDALDLSIRLDRPEGWTPEQGARVTVTYEKARDPHGDAVRPFEAWLKEDGHGGAYWEVSAPGAVLNQERLVRVLSVLPSSVMEAMSTYAVEEAAGVKHGTGLEMLKALEAEGLVCSEGGLRNGGRKWWRK